VHTDYGHIEHFKPKALFPELTFEWDNLLLACGRCNGTENKGEQWFSESEQQLVNPVTELPEDFFEFYFDENTLLALVIPKNFRGDVSEQVYGLNREELRRQRSKFVRNLIALAHFYHENAEAKSILDAAIENGGEYAAFARMVKNKYAI
jgi:uncharacterized protein (TIGR02646 family)